MLKLLNFLLKVRHLKRHYCISLVNVSVLLTVGLKDTTDIVQFTAKFPLHIKKLPSLCIQEFLRNISKCTNLSYNGNEELKMSNEERLVDVKYNCKEVDPCLFCRNQGKCINQHWKRCKPNLKPAFFSQFTKKKD